VAEFLEPVQEVSPLRSEMTAFPCHVEQPPVAVVLGLEEPGRVVKRVRPRGEQDRLNRGEGAADSWAHAGSSAAYELPVALPTRRCITKSYDLPLK
jgi:hypothetical protein